MALVLRTLLRAQLVQGTMRYGRAPTRRSLPGVAIVLWYQGFSSYSARKWDPRQIRARSILPIPPQSISGVPRLTSIVGAEVHTGSGAVGTNPNHFGFY